MEHSAPLDIGASGFLGADGTLAAMDGGPRRFKGYRYPEGLLVLDEATGEVTLVPSNGSPPRQLRAPALDVPVVHAETERKPAPTTTAATARLHATEFDREVIATFPSPVARVYARLFDESDPRQQCRLLVDTFATLLKLWSLALASQYIALPQTRDAALNELLTRDFSRPLISVWHLFTLRALSVFKGDNVTLFTPELATAYETLETKCKTPFMAKSRFEDANGEARTRESKLGKIQALIKYRNGLAHGYNLAPGPAAQHLATYLPVLREILQQARFLTRYPLYCVAPASGAGELAAFPLMGAHPSGKTESLGDVSLDVAENQIFLLDRDKRTALGLGPLAVLETPDASENALEGLGRDVFLFEGNTRSAVSYASALGEHVEKQSHSPVWRRCLEKKALDVAVLRKSDLDLEKLRAASRRVTNATLNGLAQHGKYIREVAFRPPYLRERLLQFELGDYRGLVFVGDSGSGKSTLAASIADERQSAGDVVLFYRAASLVDGDLQERIARDLGLRDLYFEDFLSAAEPLFTNGARMRIIVDGVNEHPGDVATLIGSIDAMVRQTAEHPWVRVLATARTAAYERLPESARFGRLEGTRYLTSEERRGSETRHSPLVALLPLTTDEVGEIYERYRAYQPTNGVEESGEAELAFRPKTDFRTLAERGRSTVAMMRSPLMMRLLLSAFHGRDLDPELSYDEAMRLYFEQVVVGQSDPGGPRWERGAFLKSMVAELDAVSSDTIERDALHQLPALKRHMQNAQKDSPYVQLLDLGVLTEQWDRDRCVIRFGFDRLLEFLLADLHERTCTDAYGVLDLLRRSSTFGGLIGALVVSLSRRCHADKAMTFLLTVKLAASLPAEAVERRSAVLVGRGVIERMAKSTTELESITAGLCDSASALGAQILLDAFESLFRQGEVDAAHMVIDAACEVTAATDDGTLAILALHGKGCLQQQRGELDDALAAFRRVATLASARRELLAAHRAAVKQSEILRSRGALDEAMTLLDAAVPALRNGGALSDAAEARRQQAIVAQERKQLADALRLAEDALAIAREAADPHAEAACLVTCGVTAWRLGDLDAATRWYELAQRISEHLANARTMASVAGNLGVLARERCEFAAAVGWTETQLAASERMEHRRWIADALQNLGVFRQEAGDVAGAERSITEALRLWNELGNGFYRATAPVMLAFFALHRGDTNAATRLLDEAIALATEHDVADARLDAFWLRAQLALERGDSDARTWCARFKSTGDGSERRSAQVAALEVTLALRGMSEEPGVDGFARALPLLDVIRRSFDEARPLPELHELPVAAMVHLARACDERGERERAASVREAARGWLKGRPHRLAHELEPAPAARANGSAVASA
jgi:tetratricopeptide (TPR) repeat protein